MKTPANTVRRGKIIIERVRRAREQLVLRGRALKSDVIFHQSFVKNQEVIGFKCVPGEIQRVGQSVAIVGGIQVDGKADLPPPINP